jgi:hypothetical protein
LVPAGGHAFRRFAIDHPDLFSLFLGEPFPDFQIGAEAEAAGADALSRLTDRIDRAQASGFFAGLNGSLIALQLRAMAQGLATLELCGMIDATMADQVWAESFRTLVAGWAAPRRSSARSADPLG